MPPIRSREARARATIGDWMRYFAVELERSPRSPLSQGTWRLSELRWTASPAPARSTVPSDLFVAAEPSVPAARRLLAAPRTPRLNFQEWRLSSEHEVFPLRTFSHPDASRVKAWRKHARDGTLPPVLLWYVGGLEMPLLVDGHDRLRAALAERVTPRVLALWQSMERPDVWTDSARAGVIGSYEKAHQRGDALSAETRRSLNEVLVKAFHGPRREWITTARAVAELDAEWLAEVSAELAGDPADAAWDMLQTDAA